MTRAPPTPPLLASVVVCTHNPNRELLSRVLTAIGAQTIPHEHFEVIVVDNLSSPALDASELAALASRPVRVVSEKRPGLTYARVAGFRAARGEIIIFVDDDNIIASDYVEAAVEIGKSRPNVGVFGGRCHGLFERPIGRLRKHFVSYLGVREGGPDELIGGGDEWGVHEPIGAGIVVRPVVGAAYSAYVDGINQAGAMGRSGKNLMSGEDSFISRVAHCLGYQVGYFPQLNLDHFIPARRLHFSYLVRLMIAHGRSYVVLHEIVHGARPETFRRIPYKRLWRDALYLVREHQPPVAVAKILWQFGFYQQCASPPNPSNGALFGLLQARFGSVSSVSDSEYRNLSESP